MTCTGSSGYIFITPDDGCCVTLNMLSDFAVNKNLHTVASGWILISMGVYLVGLSHVCVEDKMLSDKTQCLFPLL